MGRLRKRRDGVRDTRAGRLAGLLSLRAASSSLRGLRRSLLLGSMLLRRTSLRMW